MRILDNKTDQSIKNISIFLTKAEASELRDTIEELEIYEPNMYFNLTTRTSRVAS